MSEFRVGRMWVVVAAMFAAGCGAPGSAGSDGAGGPDLDRPAAFVTILGSDTLQIERFNRDEGRIEGEVVQRSPEMLVFRYVY